MVARKRNSCSKFPRASLDHPEGAGLDIAAISSTYDDLEGGPGSARNLPPPPCSQGSRLPSRGTLWAENPALRADPVRHRRSTPARLHPQAGGRARFRLCPGSSPIFWSNSPSYCTKDRCTLRVIRICVIQQTDSPAASATCSRPVTPSTWAWRVTGWSSKTSRPIPTTLSCATWPTDCTAIG